MSGKNIRKKTRKNSNYKTVVKYVNVDQLFRKALCDYRNMPEVDPSMGRSPEVDQNKYEKAVHFRYGGADYYPGGKRKMV